MIDRERDPVELAGLLTNGEPDAPLLYVAAGGFASGFAEAAKASGHPVALWTLRDLYRGGPRRPRKTTTG